MKHSQLTHEIIGACIEVARELRPGFTESVYERALRIVLAERGLEAEAQVPLQVRFRGHIVGDFVADLVVERKVVVELKAVRALLPEHQAQLISYLCASGMDVGLLMNFGAPKLHWRRCYRHGDSAQWVGGTQDMSSEPRGPS